jgi:hypothetical protein
MIGGAVIHNQLVGKLRGEVKCVANRGSRRTSKRGIVRQLQAEDSTDRSAGALRSTVALIDSIGQLSAARQLLPECLHTSGP